MISVSEKHCRLRQKWHVFWYSIVFFVFDRLWDSIDFGVFFRWIWAILGFDRFWYFFDQNVAKTIGFTSFLKKNVCGCRTGGRGFPFSGHSHILGSRMPRSAATGTFSSAKHENAYKKRRFRSILVLVRSKCCENHSFYNIFEKKTSKTGKILKNEAPFSGHSVFLQIFLRKTLQRCRKSSGPAMVPATAVPHWGPKSLKTREIWYSIEMARNSGKIDKFCIR